MTSGTYLVNVLAILFLSFCLFFHNINCTSLPHLDLMDIFPNLVVGLSDIHNELDVRNVFKYSLV